MSHGSAVPLISFVMPVLNGEAYLDEALDSIVAQSLDDFECIVVDDGSTDGTAAMLERRARLDPRIRVVPQAHAGLVPALNAGCRAARGVYIARMDADDTATPDRLERQIAVFESHPGTAVVGGQVQMVMPGGATIATTSFPLAPEEIAEALQSRNVICHPCATFKRDAFLRAGGYRTPFPYAEDFDLWLRIAEHHELRNVPEVLVRYRCHAGQASIVHVEQQMFSTMAGLAAARIRRSTGQDPIDYTHPVTKADLHALGVEERSIEMTMTNRCMTLAGGAIGDGQFGPAEALLLRALSGVRILNGIH